MDTRWKVLGLVFVTRIALGFQFQVVGSITPVLVDDLHFDFRLSGILVGLFFFAGVFLSFPAGYAHRYLTDKGLVVLGLLLMGLGGFLSASSDAFTVMAIGRIISGAGFVFSTLYYAKVIADWFSGKELATAMAILVMSWPVGIAAGQVLHPVIARGTGHAVAFQVASAYCIFAAIVVWLGYRSPVAETSQQLNVKARLSRHYFQLTVIAALVWALFNAVYAVYLSFIVELLTSQGFSASRAEFVGSIPSWIMIVSAIGSGLLVDRMGKRDLVLTVSLLLTAVSLLLLAYGVGVYVNIMILGTIGFGSAGVIFSLTGDAMPAESRAFGMGIFLTVYFVVGLPAPGVAGRLYDISGSAATPMMFASVMCVLAALCNFYFRKRLLSLQRLS